MKIISIFPFIFLLATLSLSAQTFEIRKKDSIDSKILGETRHFKIILPSTYEQYSKIKYPVLYILDGDFLIQSTSGIVEYMSKTGQIPEMIQVYILNTDRTRDFTPTHTDKNYEGKIDSSLEKSGGGKNFLDFLNNELVQYIDKNYRTNSFNMLVGRSFGGLIGGFDYLQEKTELNSYLLIDPSFWWNEQITVKLAENVLYKVIENKRMYISSSDNFEFSNYIEKMRNSQVSFFEKIKNKNNDHTKIKIEIFEQNTHGTVTIPSLYNGLVFLFENYFLAGMKYRSADEIINHFAQFSDNNGAEFTPLEGMINWLASVQNEKDSSQALKLYELNVNNYPKSINALLTLAEQYEHLNMTEKAVEKYTDILKIDGGNKKAIERIEQLKN
ncbi:MAG: alpha/beta hydrolase-fold protein [Flagellimonas sp.]